MAIRIYSLKIKYSLLILLFFTIQAPAIAAGCINAVKHLENQGYIFVKIDEGDAFAAIEPLIWKNSPYARKLGIASCIKEVYRVQKVYIVFMDRTNVAVAIYDGIEFKVY